eukprot:jgi/Astpho2/5036/Aster-x0225
MPIELPQGPDVFGYRAPPAGITPSREVLRWVQSLDLSLSLRNARRDVANGYIVAEIMHRYYPDNWDQIKKVAQRKSLPIPKDLIEGTMKVIWVTELPGAAVLLLENLYEQLTKKSVQHIPVPVAPAADGAAQSAPKPNQPVAGGAMEEGPLNPIAGSKPITTSLQTGPGVEFGAVKLQTVDEAVTLRQKMAAR